MGLPRGRGNNRASEKRFQVSTDPKALLGLQVALCLPLFISLSCFPFLSRPRLLYQENDMRTAFLISDLKKAS